jgi:hypothetical protein
MKVRWCGPLGVGVRCRRRPAHPRLGRGASLGCRAGGSGDWRPASAARSCGARICKVRQRSVRRTYRSSCPATLPVRRSDQHRIEGVPPRSKQTRCTVCRCHTDSAIRALMTSRPNTRATTVELPGEPQHGARERKLHPWVVVDADVQLFAPRRQRQELLGDQRVVSPPRRKCCELGRVASLQPADDLQAFRPPGLGLSLAGQPRRRGRRRPRRLWLAPRRVLQRGLRGMSARHVRPRAPSARPAREPAARARRAPSR